MALMTCTPVELKDVNIWKIIFAVNVVNLVLENMIERLLDRFRGCASYENGIKYSILARVKCTGTGFNVELIDTPPVVVPILVSNKVRKEVIPFENEKKIDFEITYL